MQEPVIVKERLYERLPDGRVVLAAVEGDEIPRSEAERLGIVGRRASAVVASSPEELVDADEEQRVPLEREALQEHADRVSGARAAAEVNEAESERAAAEEPERARAEDTEMSKRDAEQQSRRSSGRKARRGAEDKARRSAEDK